MSAPFHLAFPVHDLEAARHFYGTVLGCSEGRTSERWIDFNLYGHQIVAHLVNSEFRAQSYYNEVDKDDVPVPHQGVVLSIPEFHALADRLKSHDMKFIIEPCRRFVGQPGDQWTMFFQDKTGNNLEFKAMVNPENLFAKYHVAQAKL